MTNQTHKVIEEGVAELSNKLAMQLTPSNEAMKAVRWLREELTQYSQKLVESAKAEEREEVKEEPANNLAKWLHEHHPNLGPHVWEACCRVFGSRGTPEATMAYKQIVFTIKQTLTKDTPAED